MSRVPALRSGLIADTTDGELVVLDTVTGTAHLLKGAAADAFHACSTGAGEATDEGLAALASAGLLDERPSRRLLLQGAAVAVGAGLVTTLSVPTPAAAVSGGGTGTGGGTSAFYGFTGADRSDIDAYGLFYFAWDVPLTAGELTSFQGYARTAGTVYGLVLDAAHKVLYTSASQAVPAGAAFTIPASFTVPAGSVLGLGTDGSLSTDGVVPFTNGGPTIYYTADGTAKPAVGTTLPQQGTSPRTYSFGANITS